MSANIQDGIELINDKFLNSIERRLDRAKEERNSTLIVENVDHHIQRYSMAQVFTCFYKQDNVIDFCAETDEWQSMANEPISILSSKFIMIPLVFPQLNNLAKLFIKYFHLFAKLEIELNSFIKQLTELYRC